MENGRGKRKIITSPSGGGGMLGTIWVIHTMCLASGVIDYPLDAMPRMEQSYGQHGREGVVLNDKEPIRISWFLHNLTCTGSGRCFCSEAGDKVNNFQGTDFTCKEEDVLTAEKEEYLTLIMGEAVAFLQKAMRVHHVNGPLKGAAPICGIPMPSDHSDVRGVMLPADHLVTGVPETDFIVYATSVPSSNQTQAWALSCQLDHRERPIVAMINFVPALLTPASKVTAPAEHTNSVNTAIHELFHALGYSVQYYTSTRWFPTYPIKEINGRHFFTGSKVLEKAKEHFNCSELQGLELENQGGTGTMLSHWEKRILGNEAMTGAQTDEVSVISEMTLAYFEDSGLYSVDYSMAGKLRFGKDKGCSFVQDRCDKIEPRSDFCFPEPSEPYREQCTSSLLAHGPCMVAQYNADLDPEYQYFSDPKRGGYVTFSDYCPFYSALTQCTDEDTHDTLCPKYITERDCVVVKGCVWGTTCVSIKHVVQGESFGASSRCFKSDVVAKGWKINSASRCFDVTCAADSASYLVRVGTHDVYCGQNNAVGITPEGFSGDWIGSIPCEDPSLLCDGTVKVGEVPSPPPMPETNPPGKNNEIDVKALLPVVGGGVAVVIIAFVLYRCVCKSKQKEPKGAMKKNTREFVMPPATIQTQKLDDVVVMDTMDGQPLQSPLLPSGQVAS